MLKHLQLSYTDYPELVFKMKHLDHPLVVGVSIGPEMLLEALKVSSRPHLIVYCFCINHANGFDFHLLTIFSLCALENTRLSAQYYSRW